MTAIALIDYGAGNLRSVHNALVAAGGSNVDVPWFGMKDPDAQLVGARGAAIKEAEAKAADYARLAGYRGAELVSLSEGSFGGPQPPMPMMQVSSSAVRSAPCFSAHSIAVAGSATRNAIALAEGPCAARNSAMAASTRTGSRASRLP